ncbi:MULTISPECIES: hypothetical protein [Streptomyces violaceusniger group]|uniref:Uncharacterized protein n=2 Tax=Streptomyces rhizosphaericus TaxID=114699 RepID=A0ABN1SPW7_9ACTN|nr:MULTISPECIES: hypothetical protein [Streptomyces violaceusniger group]
MLDVVDGEPDEPTDGLGIEEDQGCRDPFHERETVAGHDLADQGIVGTFNRGMSGWSMLQRRNAWTTRRLVASWANQEANRNTPETCRRPL